MQHGAWWIGQEALDPPVALLLQIPRYACERASRTRGTGEGVDFATCLVPDLGTSSLDMRLSVGHVVELVRPDGVLKPVRVSLRLVVVVLWVVKRYRRYWVYLCTEQSQQVDLSLRLCVWHVDYQSISFGTADVCETNASVSGCALDDGAARLQETLALGVLDDEEGGAILDGATRVLEFGLSEDIAAGLFGEALEADKRSFTDGCNGVLAQKATECECQSMVPSRKPR